MTLLSPDVDERTTTDERTSARADTPWVTVVWDDPVNLMSYVTHVFVTYFHYSKDKARQLMLEVHNRGRSVVATGLPCRQSISRKSAVARSGGR